MAHTVQKVNVGNNALAVVKITSYVHGGESFTLAEFGLTGSLTDLIFLLNPDSPIVPRYMGGGLVQLVGDEGQDIPDLPSNANLNFVFAVIVQGVN